MGNCIISYPNRGDGATLGGGSWSSDLPQANLKNRRIARVARTTDASDGSFVITGDFGQLRPMRLVALVNHNFSTAATYRFRVFSDAGLTNVDYDSGVLPVFGVVYNELTADWDNGNFWDLILSAEDRDGLTATLIHVLDYQWTNQYFKLEIFDSTNLDGYLQAGRLFVGSGWIPIVNMDSGASIGFDARDQIDEAISGAEYFEKRRAPRIAKFNLPYMEDAEGWQVAFEIQRKQATTDDVFYMWDVDDSVNVLRRSFLGRLKSLSPIDQPYVNKTSTSFEIKEQI